VSDRADAVPRRRVAVFGAGAIGCWVGSRLAAVADVTLIGRPRIIEALADGVRATDLDGGDVRSKPTLATEPAAAAAADLVIVTVKSAATAEAGAALASHVRRTAAVVSLQNGVRNARVLADALPGRRVVAGMVPFNVVRPEPDRFHRATEGALLFAPCPELADACAAAGLAYAVRDDMPAVMWGKLVINLGNAINALCGLPLAEQLSQRAFRRCLAACQREALATLRAAGEHAAKLLVVPPRWMPALLELPDPVFRALARRMVAVDPTARSSMWDDLEHGRTTEIDYLQGEIVALADRLRRPAPVNRRVVELVRVAEAGGRRDYTGAELAALVLAA
jgi:2-dehydropantoate 2-reductase